MRITARRFTEFAERALTELERPVVGIEIVRTRLKRCQCRLGDQALEAFLEDGNLMFLLRKLWAGSCGATEMADGFFACKAGDMPSLTELENRRVPSGVIIGASRKGQRSSPLRQMESAQTSG
jgi:hypothetical protein